MAFPKDEIHNNGTIKWPPVKCAYFQLKQTKDVENPSLISRHFLSKTLQTRQLDDVKRRPRWPDAQFGNQEFRNKRA